MGAGRAANSVAKPAAHDGRARRPAVDVRYPDQRRSRRRLADAGARRPVVRAEQRVRRVAPAAAAGRQRVLLPQPELLPPEWPAGFQFAHRRVEPDGRDSGLAARVFGDPAVAGRCPRDTEARCRVARAGVQLRPQLQRRGRAQRGLVARPGPVQRTRLVRAAGGVDAQQRRAQPDGRNAGHPAAPRRAPGDHLHARLAAGAAHAAHRRQRDAARLARPRRLFRRRPGRQQLFVHRASPARRCRRCAACRARRPPSSST